MEATTTTMSSGGSDETDPDVAWALSELAKDPITWIIIMALIICCCGCGLVCFAYKISQIKRNNADAIAAIKTITTNPTITTTTAITEITGQQLQ